MLNIVLYEPEIPQNTGNIARTCAVTGIRLHLIKPLGFDISDKAVKRAGLDYWHLVDLRVYENLEDFFRKTGAQDIWLATSKAPRPYTEAQFRDECYLIFGKETAGGVPAEIQRPVHPYPHPGGGPVPQSFQLSGDPSVRSPATTGFSRIDRERRDERS